MQYFGHAENGSEIQLSVIGNNVDTMVVVDLAAAPFSMPFPKGSWPDGYHIRMEDGVAPATITFSQSNMTLQFTDPPPPPNEGTLSPRTQMIIYLLFGSPMGSAKRKRRR